MATPRYEFESFRVDVIERRLWQNGKPVALTPKVFDLLVVLLENKGQTVEKDTLIRSVWSDTYVEEGSLNRSISTLRKALGDDSNEQRLIKTLPKRGYRFTENVIQGGAESSNVVEVGAIERESEPSLEQRGYSFLRYRSAPLVAISVVVAFVLVLAWTMTSKQPNLPVLAGLTRHERRQLEKRGSMSSEATSEYIRGRSLWHERSAEGLHESIIHLERAVKNDESFALAHAAIADAYAFDVNKRVSARDHAETAIKLDPSLGEPYASIGFVQMFWEWKLSDAGESFSRAIELSPDYATAHQWYAINLVASRSGGAALAEMKHALELEPDSLAIRADLCQVNYFLQKYDDAIDQCRRTLESDPNFLNAHLYLYEVYTAKGLYDEAVSELFATENLKSDFVLPAEEVEKLRLAYGRGGINAFWKARIAYLEKNPHSYELARYNARLGNEEKAIEWLQGAHEAKDFDFVFFLTDPVFRDLADNPKFKALARSFNGS